MHSILTQYTQICAVCGQPAEASHHLVFGTSARQLAEEDDLKLPLCNKHHNTGKVAERIHDNPMAEDLSKKLGQLAWEKEFYKLLFNLDKDPARDAFMKRYGKSYL